MLQNGFSTFLTVSFYLTNEDIFLTPISWQGSVNERSPLPEIAASGLVAPGDILNLLKLCAIHSDYRTYVLTFNTKVLRSYKRQSVDFMRQRPADIGYLSAVLLDSRPWPTYSNEIVLAPSIFAYDR